MRADVLTLAIAALAMATETRVGDSDPEVLDLILEPLPDESVFDFVALLRVYQGQHDRYGPEALRRCGLALARSAYGVGP